MSITIAGLGEVDSKIWDYEHDQTKARTEGWVIGVLTGEIIRVGPRTTYETQEHVREHIRQRAEAGSEFHQRAIAEITRIRLTK